MRAPVRPYLMFLPFLAALSLSSGGCLVATSRFDAKVREADALRDALASVNREKGALEARNEALSAQLAAETESSEKCAARSAEQEEELGRIREEFQAASRNYEGTRITREQFITELLEKEKGSGRKIQELGSRLQNCEAGREALARESASLKQAVEDLTKRAEETPDSIALRMERDILLGRVERLTEEKARADRRRNERFAALSRDVAAISPEVTATAAGPALRLLLPGTFLSRPGKRDLSDAGRAVIGTVGKAATEFPAASVIVAADGGPVAEEIRAFLTRDANLPGDRVLAVPGGREKGAAELFLLVP